MFEEQVYAELERLQDRLAELRQRYERFCKQEVKDAMGAAHTAIDTAVDAAQAALEADRYRDTVCPQCQSKQAKLEKHDMADWDRWNIFCPDCKHHDLDVSFSDVPTGVNLKV